MSKVNPLEEGLRSAVRSRAAGEMASGHVASQQCRLTLPTPCQHPSPCGVPCELELGPERHAALELGSLARLAIMAEPGTRGTFRDQAHQLFAQVRCIVSRQPRPLTPVSMIVFLRHAGDEAVCRKIVRACFLDSMPVTTYVVQPPCSSAALGIELWAMGGPGVHVRRLASEVTVVESEGIRWIYCGGITGAAATDPYREATTAFQSMEQQLARAGVGFEQVMRTWIYVNQITSGPDGRQRYQEFNRARTDFFRHLRFGAKLRRNGGPEVIYPASTGIGTSGERITMACVAIDSQRPDVFIVPLENPQQTSAFDYAARYSPQSPKFARAMALVQGHFITTLVSGTASIVDSKTVFAGDVVRQTEQTLENIERLIAPDNFSRHGLDGSGATLRDIAKLRVYVKHADDYERARAVVEARLPHVPAIYLQADVCRPDLLVEIEAVAFSPFTGSVPRLNGHAVDGAEQRSNP